MTKKPTQFYVVDPQYRRPPPRKAKPQNPNLTTDGSELLSDVSLVAVADMRPPSLGERVHRYLRNRDYSENDLQWDDDGPDEFPDDEENPMSPYEDRAHDLVKKSRKKRAEREEAEKAKKAEEDKIELERLQGRLDELKAKGSTPPPPPTQTEA